MCNGTNTGKSLITAWAVNWFTPCFPNLSFFQLMSQGGLPENPGRNYFHVNNKVLELQMLTSVYTHAHFEYQLRINFICMHC